MNSTLGTVYGDLYAQSSRVLFDGVSNGSVPFQ